MRQDRKSCDKITLGAEKSRGSFETPRRKNSVLETQETDSKARLRMNYFGEAIELDNLKLFLSYGITFVELTTLRFEYNMNILQLVCHEEALEILQYLCQFLAAHEGLRKELTNYRDSHLGSQAIHLAAASGNNKIIRLLHENFGASLTELNGHGQTVLHCAAQRYEGIASLFLFSRQFCIDVSHKDERGATALHFAAIGLFIKNVQALIKLGADPNC